jgi:hypothetical protein
VPISDIPPRGICYYQKNDKSDAYLVLGPKHNYANTEGKFSQSTSNTTSQHGIISREISNSLPGSYKRLNMLRALLNLQPFIEVFDEMGDMKEEVKRLQSADRRHTWTCDGNWTTLGLCCPDATASFTTFDCLLNMCPESMAWVFTLQFNAKTDCEDGQSSHSKVISKNTLQVDCSCVESTSWEGCLRKHLQKIYSPCSAAADFMMELQTAPLALSVIVQNPNNQCKQLNLNLSHVFDKSPCAETKYKLMSVCSKGKNINLWDAHCRFPLGDKWRTYQNYRYEGWMTCYDWDRTKLFFRSATVLHLFYVNEACLDQAHTAGIPNYDMRLVDGCWIECFFRDKAKFGLASERKFPAQIIKKRQYSNTFFIRWDDNDQNDRIKNHDEIWPLLQAEGNSKFKIGMHVTAQHGDRWLEAVICSCFQDERYLVEYKGSVQTLRVRYASEIKIAGAETVSGKGVEKNSSCRTRRDNNSSGETIVVRH